MLAEQSNILFLNILSSQCSLETCQRKVQGWNYLYLCFSWFYREDGNAVAPSEKVRCLNAQKEFCWICWIEQALRVSGIIG